jgi:hypothetical protein
MQNGTEVMCSSSALDDRTDETERADTRGYKNGGATELCAAFAKSARVSALFEAVVRT